RSGPGPGPGAAVMGSGRRPLLLPLLLLLPAVRGDCGPLPTISNAEPLEDPQHRENFSVGSMVTYRCRAGYTKLPLRSDTIECLSTSQWSNLPEFCGLISCLPPPPVKNGQLNNGNRDFTFGMAVTYSCNEGFALIGDATIHCTADEDLTGQWSGPAPECKVISCLPPPPVKNGQLNNGNRDFTFGMAVTYSCNEGFALIGDATIHCTADGDLKGQWSGPPAPECRGGNLYVCSRKPFTLGTTTCSVSQPYEGHFVPGPGQDLGCSEMESAAKRINSECLHLSDTSLKNGLIQGGCFSL
uniref:Uncharacterized protein n=1 Tax=Melopsittacus undulatus TaxID=13146 RepID=A0A8V5H6X5_MELUD